MAIVAWRNNNPGNLSFGSFAQKFGALYGVRLPDGQNNAYFPNMAAGYAAFQSLTTGWASKYGTIASMGARYAQDSGWAAGVAKFSGIGLNEGLDPNNPSQMAALCTPWVDK